MRPAHTHGGVLFFVMVVLSLVQGHPGFWSEMEYDWSYVFDSSPYDQGMVLSSEYILFWRVDNSQTYITFAAVVRTLGWVGFGLSSSGSMIGADIVTLEIINNSFVITDRYADVPGPPASDAHQDKFMHKDETRQEDGVTIFVWSQMISTCNSSQNDRWIRNSVQWVIFAYGNNDTSIMEYHQSNRGQQLISFLTPSMNTQNQIPVGQPSVTLTSPTVTIPTAATTYMCSRQNLPSNRKYHVTYVEPIVQSPMVHHMILYICYTGSSSIPTKPAPCGGMGSCTVFWTGWALGSRAASFPPEAGLPMGVGNGTNISFAVLQIHYNNPLGIPNTTDSSGFRLYYTPTLRQYDMGTLSVAQPLLSIPPGRSYIEATSWCISNCTSGNVPSSGIIITDVHFHMHQLGYSAIARHYLADGTEIEPLGIAERYDFNMQTGIPPPVGRKIHPGDSIFLSCGFNSMTATKVTNWGEASTDEMCMLFISYYPLMTMATCGSLPGSGYCLTKGFTFAKGDTIASFTALSLEPGWTVPCNSDEILHKLYPQPFSPVPAPQSPLTPNSQFTISSSAILVTLCFALLSILM